MPSPPAERMRAYRNRRREELHYIRILLGTTDIDRMIMTGVLKEEQRRDPDALRRAASGLLLDWALDDPKFIAMVARAVNPIDT